MLQPNPSVQQAFADDVRQEFSAPWPALFSRQHPLPTFFVDNTIPTLVDYLCKVLRLAPCEAFSFSAQNLNSQSGDFHVNNSLQRPCRSVFFHVCQWPSVPLPLFDLSYPSLLLPRAQRIAGPRRRTNRPRYLLFLLRPLSLCLRSHRRPRSSLFRRRFWRTKTQNRLHSCLPRPDLAPGHPSRPGRIHQRLWHRLLAPRRLFLRQRQLQIPHATCGPALRLCPTTPSVFTACPGSATTSARPCPATPSCPATHLEQPTRTRIAPPGTVILKFQRISGIEGSQPRRPRTLRAISLSE